MRRVGRYRALGWAVGVALTTVAIAASLLGNTNVGLAALAALAGLGVAISVDAWHRSRAFAAHWAAHTAHMASVGQRLDVLRLDIDKLLTSHRLALAADIESLSDRAQAEAKAQEDRQRAALDAAIAAIVKGVRRDSVTSERRQTGHIEALLQVLPRLGDRPLLPASGGWALDARALAELADVIAVRSPKLVLELGSGTSTVWIAALLEASGGHLVSIDHDEVYAEATRAHLRRHNLTGVAEVRVAPLVEHAPGRPWYDPAALAGLTGIDMLVVDGPPGATCTNARQPALEVLRTALAPRAAVALDDIVRSDEQEILALWLREWPEFTRIDSGTSSLAVIAETAD